jgi:hypothetical protein
MNQIARKLCVGWIMEPLISLSRWLTHGPFAAWEHLLGCCELLSTSELNHKPNIDQGAPQRPPTQRHATRPL